MKPTNSPPVCCTFRGARSCFVGRLVLYWLLSKPPESLEQLCGFLFMSGLLGSVLGSIIGTWIGAWLDAWRAKSIGALVKLLIIQVGGTLVFLMLLLK